MKLSEIKGEAALDAMADLMEPLALIFADAEVQASVKKDEPKMLLIKKILKGHTKEVLEVLAILDGEDPATYETNLLKIPAKLLEIMNDPEVQSLFTYQDQRAE